MFSIIHQDGAARCGVLHTLHGEINTPAFIPLATQGTVKALAFEQLDELGFESVMCNTYHLYLRPGAELVQGQGGLHAFLNYRKPLWTDSGGFQVFSLKNCRVSEESVTFFSHIDQSRHEFTPEKAILVQQQLGADIIFAFDHCIPHNSDYETARAAMERTHRWAERCVQAFQQSNAAGRGDSQKFPAKSPTKSQALFGIVQGGKFPELRRESAGFISSLPFDGYGMGSLFGEPKGETRQIAKAMLEILPPDKPKHFLGIGGVEDIFAAVELGGDTFDCVLPTRLARIGYAFLRPDSGGSPGNKFRLRITGEACKEERRPLDPSCGCGVCLRHSRAYLRHLWKARELAFYSLMTFHNLYFFRRLMLEIREAINKRQFQKLKEAWLSDTC